MAQIQDSGGAGGATNVYNNFQKWLHNIGVTTGYLGAAAMGNKNAQQALSNGAAQVKQNVSATVAAVIPDVGISKWFLIGGGALLLALLLRR